MAQPTSGSKEGMPEPCNSLVPSWVETKPASGSVKPPRLPPRGLLSQCMQQLSRTCILSLELKGVQEVALDRQPLLQPS